MIYLNFFYLIVAISLFVYAPEKRGPDGHPWLDLVFMLILFFAFFYFNKSKFQSLRKKHSQGELGTENLKKECIKYINLYTLFSLFLFGLELFTFNLKYYLYLIPWVKDFETLGEILGITIFLLHLVIIWYWAARVFGNIFTSFYPVKKYILSNIKFNVAIFTPWVVFSLIRDIIYLVRPPWLENIWNSTLFNIGFLLLFLFSLAVFAPVFILRLWDCEPFENIELKHKIEQYCRRQKVKFWKIRLWKALNNSLVTAAVVGLVPWFRSLLFSPRLLEVLDEDEVLGVTSHEVGHVKKHHPFYYLIFFIILLILSMGIINLIIYRLLIMSDLRLDFEIIRFVMIFVPLSLFVLFFRFVFGFFMRNFERQADLFCFESGVNPNYLISSFMKLGVTIGDDGKKANWHHYNINQRMEYIRACRDNPGLIKKHERKIKKSLLVFVSCVVLVFVLLLPHYSDRTQVILDNLSYIKIFKLKSDYAAVYSLYGLTYYQIEEWNKARTYYQKSLEVNYRQAMALNNLAWLLLTCPDRRFLDPGKALQYAKDSVEIDKKAYNLDTLAEAYLQNFKLKEALRTAKEALKYASPEELEQFKKRYREMVSRTREFDSRTI